MAPPDMVSNKAVGEIIRVIRGGNTDRSCTLNSSAHVDACPSLPSANFWILL
jgi:hypothetical protein